MLAGTLVPVLQLRHDNHNFAQRLLYSSWRRPPDDRVKPLVHAPEAVQSVCLDLRQDYFPHYS
jgi:hypothetical protein